LTPKTVAELAALPNIVGIKDSSGSFDNIQQYLEVAASDFALLAGTGSLILPTLMAGGKGAIAATANVFPEVLVSIYENWRNGDFAGAERAQRRLRPAERLLSRYAAFRVEACAEQNRHTGRPDAGVGRSADAAGG